MIALAFIGDGPRDQVTVPRLVERVLGAAVGAPYNAIWKDIRLNRGSGLDRKLAFALAEAKSDGLAGLVATIDEDTIPGRLAQLEQARAADRERAPPFPLAIGQARPHGEAWLLDDAVAVRAGLGLDASTQVPAPQQCKEPKRELEALHARSRSAGERYRESFARIAALVEVARCAQRERTGFGEFAEDVRRELGALAHS